MQNMGLCSQGCCCLLLLLPGLLLAARGGSGGGVGGLVTLLGEAPCMGVALTRHHVLTVQSCLGGRAEVRVQLAGRPGKTVQGGRLGWQHPRLALVGLARGLTGAGGLIIGEAKLGAPLVVQGEGGQVRCSLGGGGLLQCGPGTVLAPGSPVLGPQGHLVGLVGSDLGLEALQLLMKALGQAVGGDLASRHRQGERGLLKCRKTESLALDLLLTSYVEAAGGQEDRPEDRLEQMQGDAGEDLSGVVQELKMELAGAGLVVVSSDVVCRPRPAAV